MSSPNIPTIAVLCALLLCARPAHGESAQPASLQVIATNNVLERPTSAQHTIRGLGRNVEPSYSIVHPSYTVQMSSWSRSWWIIHWKKFGPEKTIVVGQVSTLEAKPDQLYKMSINIPEMNWGHLGVPDHSLKLPKMAGGEPHVRLELHFYSANRAEIATWLVESANGMDNRYARNWEFTEQMSSPRVAVSLPTNLDSCDGDRCFIIKVAKPDEPDLAK